MYVFRPLLDTTEDHQENNMKNAKGDNEVYEYAWLFRPKWIYSKLMNIIKETYGFSIFLLLLQVWILLRDQN